MAGSLVSLLLIQLSQGVKVDYLVEPTSTGLYRIKYSGKGSMPVALRGRYTSRSEIASAVSSYLAKKERNTNAKKQTDG